MSTMNDLDQAVIEEFRANAGKVGGHFTNQTLLLLHTIGAKSGQARINPVVYLRDGDRYIIFASKAGAPTHPDWYHNLVANVVEIEVGSERFPVRATVAVEPERTRLFDQIATASPGFAEYQRNTTRYSCL